MKYACCSVSTPVSPSWARPFWRLKLLIVDKCRAKFIQGEIWNAPQSKVFLKHCLLQTHIHFIDGRKGYFLYSKMVLGNWRTQLRGDSLSLNDFYKLASRWLPRLQLLAHLLTWLWWPITMATASSLSLSSHPLAISEMSSRLLCSISCVYIDEVCNKDSTRSYLNHN